MSDSASDSSDSTVARAGGLPQNAAWSEVTRLSDGTFRVRLGGLFGPGWLASLCRGLAERRINIERAHAMRTRNLSWIAEFTAVPLDGSDDPDRIAYLALANAPCTADDRSVRLRRFEIEPCFDGTLKLSFEARDGLGLLGALLARLAAMALFPVEMHIETQTELASDTLWLCTTDGASPSSELRARLEAELTAKLSHGKDA